MRRDPMKKTKTLPTKLVVYELYHIESKEVMFSRPMHKRFNKWPKKFKDFYIILKCHEYDIEKKNIEEFCDKNVAEILTERKRREKREMNRVFTQGGDSFFP